MTSILESIVVLDDEESVTRYYVCIILKLAPYKRRRCFIPDGSGVARTALQMVEKVSIVH